MKFDLVTPEKLVISKEAEQVVVPGVEGDFGVLSGHSPLISAVRPGVCAIYQGEQVIETVFVTGGFAEVTGEKLSILADAAFPVESINVEETTAKLREAQSRLQSLNDAPDSAETRLTRHQVEKEVEIATRMLEAKAQ